MKLKVNRRRLFQSIISFRLNKIHGLCLLATIAILMSLWICTAWTQRITATESPDAEVEKHELQNVQTFENTKVNNAPLLSSGKIAFIRLDFDRIKRGSENYGVYTMNSDGSNPTRLTDGGHFAGGVAMSRDGSKIAFNRVDSNDNDFLYIMNTDGSNRRLLAVGGDLPSFSPDGAKVVFTSGGGLSIINVDGTSLRALTGNGQYSSFSPDGSKIVFDTDDGDIYLINIDGTNPHLITENGVSPSFSPVNNTIVFTRDTKKVGDSLYVMNADGSNQVNLRELHCGRCEGPSFSPDGNQIVFIDIIDPHSHDILVMNANGSGVVRLTDGEDNFQPSWGAGGPFITEVRRKYAGVFLKGFNENNDFDVRIDWKGSLGRVRFQINDNPPFEVVGDTTGVIHPFKMNEDFPFRDSPSLIKITPINGEGVTGATKTEQIYVFDYPTWLQTAVQINPSAITFTTQPGEMRANFDVVFPNPEFRALTHFPSFVPFVGGDLGISKAQGTFSGFVSSLGTGNLTLAGETKFKGLGQELSGTASGSGNFLLNQNGLSVSSATFNLGLQGTVSREVSLITAIPALAPFRRFPAVRRFTDTTRLRGELKPSVNFSATWKQDPITRDLVFNEGTGTVGLTMRAVLNSRINDRIRFQGWVSGGGEITVGTPSPFVRNLNLNLEAGAQLNIDSLFGGAVLRGTIDYECSYTPETGEANCSSNSLANPFRADNRFNPKLKLIRPRYERFGIYESFRIAPKDEDKQKDVLPSLLPAVDGTIVSNVFAGAEPTILPVGSNGKMLLWVRQNPSLPVLQSTEIAWSYYDGTNWTAPAIITTDTRAEFSPVAGVNANGKIVAAWLKIKTPAFNAPVPTFDDLPLYYKQVEVVSAVFDPATRTWSSETSLTNDSALDTSLRMARDSSGNLLLTWQSNPNGEFTADSANPATLKYSFWNGSSWNAPAVVASNLSNASEHAVALKGNNAFIVLPYDPDINVSNDSKLLVYNWNGTAWSQGSVFAGDNVDNNLPNAVYDTTGKGQIIWLRGGNLVQANLTNPTPQIVRQGSESTAFYNIRLLNNTRDNLTLIWQEVVDNNPANIFAKVYNPASNTWSDDRRLNQDEWQSKDVSGYYDNLGNLQLAYLATQILRVTQTVTINGQTYQIPNVPQNGQTDLRLLTVNQAKSNFDFDGDGKSDISVFRPDNGAWYLLQSQNGFTGLQFGLAADKLAPADYDGDGKTDLAVVRNGVWYLQRSQAGFTNIQFGDGNDIPVPADYDGDGKADLAVFRPSNGTWYLQQSAQGFTGIQFGQTGDKPVAADYDGDGKADLAVNRGGIWYIQRSQLGFYGVQFGDSNDKLVPADYDGDGKADIAVFRPSNGVWYLQQSTAGFAGLAFGLGTDIPAAADYDGDGKADVAVVRGGNWYLNRTTQGFVGIQFGTSTDKPIPNAFVR